MRFSFFSATSFQRAASPGIGLLIVGLLWLGCGGKASGGPASGGDAQAAADRYAEGAVVAVRDYLDALDEGDYARAYGHWSHDYGMPTFDEFKRQRANIAAVQADIGKARYVQTRRPVVGSSNVTVPVQLQITHTDDSQECAKGTYELSKAVVPGSQWIITSSDIKEC